MGVYSNIEHQDMIQEIIVLVIETIHKFTKQPDAPASTFVLLYEVVRFIHLLFLLTFSMTIGVECIRNEYEGEGYQETEKVKILNQAAKNQIQIQNKIDEFDKIIRPIEENDAKKANDNIDTAKIQS